MEDYADSLIGIVRIHLDSLQFPNGREINPDIVQNLEEVFSKGNYGCEASYERNFIPAIIYPIDLQRILQVSNLTRAQLNNSLHQSEYRPRLQVNDFQVQCLQGQHRVEAARRCLPPSEYWWTIKLYCFSIDSPAILGFTLKEGERFSHETKFSDGEIYYKVRYYQQKEQLDWVEEWKLRLGSSKRRDLIWILNKPGYTSHLDNIVKFPGLRQGLELGNIRRHLALRCDTEIQAYLRHIYEVWRFILLGNSALERHVDITTVQLLQARAPYVSLIDRQYIIRGMESGELFPRIIDLNLRDQIQQAILRVQIIIPTIKTLHENCKLLEIGVKIIRNLLCLDRNGSLSDSLQDIWSAPAECLLEIDEGVFQRIDVSSHEECFYIAYSQIFIAAFRQFANLSDTPPLREIRDQKIASSVEPNHYRLFIARAELLGFSNKRILEMQSEGVIQLPARNTSSSSSNPLSEKLDNNLKRRFGRPFGIAYNQLQKDFFLANLPDAAEATHASAIYIQQDFIMAFFRPRPVSFYTGSLATQITIARYQDLSISTWIPAAMSEHTHRSTQEAHARRGSETVLQPRFEFEIVSEASTAELVNSESLSSLSSPSPTYQFQPDSIPQFAEVSAAELVKCDSVSPLPYHFQPDSVSPVSSHFIETAGTSSSPVYVENESSTILPQFASYRTKELVVITSPLSGSLFISLPLSPYISHISNPVSPVIETPRVGGLIALMNNTVVEDHPDAFISPIKSAFELLEAEDALSPVSDRASFLPAVPILSCAYNAIEVTQTTNHHSVEAEVLDRWESETETIIEEELSNAVDWESDTSIVVESGINKAGSRAVKTVNMCAKRGSKTQNLHNSRTYLEPRNQRRSTFGTPVKFSKRTSSRVRRALQGSKYYNSKPSKVQLIPSTSSSTQYTPKTRTLNIASRTPRGSKLQGSRSHTQLKQTLASENYTKQHQYIPSQLVHNEIDLVASRIPKASKLQGSRSHTQLKQTLAPPENYTQLSNAPTSTTRGITRQEFSTAQSASPNAQQVFSKTQETFIASPLGSEIRHSNPIAAEAVLGRDQLLSAVFLEYNGMRTTQRTITNVVEYLKKRQGWVGMIIEDGIPRTLRLDHIVHLIIRGLRDDTMLALVKQPHAERFRTSQLTKRKSEELSQDVGNVKRLRC